MIRNTRWVEGMVVYAGKNDVTKIKYHAKVLRILAQELGSIQSHPRPGFTCKCTNLKIMCNVA